MEVPLSIPPRDAGDYDAQLIYVGSRWGAVTGRPLTKFRLHVVEDADVHKRWIQQRVDEVRLCESFAAYVCITHNVEEVIDVMVGDLTDDYPARAGFAAGSLQYYNRRPLSAKTLDAIEKALQKHVDAKPITPSWEHAIPAIIRLARSDPQDRFLPAILKYSESENFYVRDEAIGALQSFHQLAATDQLVKLVDLKGVTDRFIIAHAMASRGDERELPALAEFASESNTSRSGGRPEFDLLVMFPDVKVAADAVDAGLKSTNPDIRSSAERAMHPQIMGFIDPIGREPVPKSIQDLSVQAAAKTILDASDFVVIDQATAADASVPAIAIRMIANRPGERAAAYHFIRKGTIQAKMYGLCILFFCEPPIMRKMADDLVAQGGEVSVVDNGQQSTQPVEQVIKRIVSGGYPRRLTRLYTPSNPASNPATRPVSK
jgi:hypothetical protein